MESNELELFLFLRLGILPSVGGATPIPFTVLPFAGQTNVVIPNINPQHWLAVGIRGGSNNNAGGLWYFQTSANVDGSAAHGGASDYAFIIDVSDNVNGAGTPVKTTANGSAGFQQTTGAILNGVNMDMLFDPANGGYFGQATNVLASTGQVNKFEFSGNVIPTNAQSLVFNISAGTFSGKIYYMDLG